jgi:hypothetical protein
LALIVFSRALRPGARGPSRGASEMMRLITVRFDAERGEFPPEPLAKVPGEILSLVEHFFYHDGLPCLLLVVQHRGAEAPRAGGGVVVGPFLCKPR